MAKFDPKKSAITDMKDHQYTCLVKSYGIEAWRCQRPESNIFAFDIVITRYGIAVMGDIDAMTFLVGASYGLPFLAGRDIGYYIHSKLDHQSRRPEFDEEAYFDAFKEHLSTFFRECWESLAEEATEQESNDTELPEWVFDESEIKKHSMDEIRELISKASEIAEEDETLHNLSISNDWEHPESVREAHELLVDYFEVEDVWDYSFEKTSDILMHRLYMINHAAKEIMKIKAAEAEG